MTGNFNNEQLWESIKDTGKLTWSQLKQLIRQEIAPEDGIINTNIDFDKRKDNFRAYYDIIYNRRYGGVELPNDKVTNISDFQSKDGINYNTLPDPNGEEFSVPSLNQILKNAFDPASSFKLEDIEVTEVQVHETCENKWQVQLCSVDTWYGKFKYNNPDVENIYYVPGNTAEVSEAEYNAYDFTKVTQFENLGDGEERKIRYIYKDLLEQVEKQKQEGKIDTTKCNIQRSSDILDDPMKSENGKDGNTAHFQNWTMNGLSQISTEDEGKYNDDTGGGKGSDYVYCKYKEYNIKQSKATSENEEISTNNLPTQLKKQILNTNNVVQTTTDVEKKLKAFLELLRNKTGKIPREGARITRRVYSQK